MGGDLPGIGGTTQKGKRILPAKIMRELQFDEVADLHCLHSASPHQQRRMFIKYTTSLLRQTVRSFASSSSRRQEQLPSPAASSSSSSGFGALKDIFSTPPPPPPSSSSPSPSTSSSFLRLPVPTLVEPGRGYDPRASPPKVDPVVDMFTNLIMKHGRKAEAQGKVAKILSML